MISIVVGISISTFAVDGATTTHHLFRDRIAAAFFPPEAVEETATDAGRKQRKLTHYRRDDRPLWIINTALNAPDVRTGEIKRPKAYRFELTPLYAGTDQRGYGFVRTESFGFRRSPDVMHAVTTSAAVVAPQMGEYSKLWVWVVANFLNLRLGQLARRVRDKPTSRSIAEATKELARTKGADTSNERMLARASDIDWPDLDVSLSEHWWAGPWRAMETFLRRLGRTILALGGTRSSDVYLTDGGHFDNLGLMALIERRARFIIALDAEADGGLVFGGLADVIRRARTDLDIVVDIDTSALRGEQASEMFAVGTIDYRDGEPGYLLYLKAHRAGARGIDVQAYGALNPTFPHEATANQFFSSSQFEAYRRLGQDSVRRVIEPVKDILLAQHDGASGPRTMLTAMFTALGGGAASMGMREGEGSSKSWLELLTDGSTYPAMRRALVDRMAESAGIEADLMRGALALFQHMEDVFVAHRLAVAPRAPHSAGWLALFREYAKSSELRAAWKASRHLYSDGFRRFCEREIPELSAGPPPTAVPPEAA